MAKKVVEIIAVKQFRDKFNRETIYEPGEKVSFEKKRADDVVKRGLARLADDAAPGAGNDADKPEAGES